jgi:hypothetical protein
MEVWLSRDGTPCRFKVARLVLEAFVGLCPAGMEACHFNDDPADNRLENLRWDTHSNNHYDLVRNGKHGQASKTHCRNGHEYTPENTYATVTKQGWNARYCRECWREANRRYRARKRGVA